MLGPGVSLNSTTTQAIHNSGTVDSNGTVNNTSENIKTENINMLKNDQALKNKSSDSEATKSTTDPYADLSQIKNKDNKDEDMPFSADHKIEEVEEFKKFYSLLSTYQQNPNFMAVIAAAAANVSNMAPILDENANNISNQQNLYLQLQQTSKKSSQLNKNLKSEPKEKPNMDIKNLNGTQVRKLNNFERYPDSNKKQKNDQDYQKTKENFEKKNGEFRGKLKSKHNQHHSHHKRHQHYHHKHKGVVTENIKSDSKLETGSHPITPSSSLSSCSSNASYSSSSSISSDSNSSNSSTASSSPPPCITNATKSKLTKINMSIKNESEIGENLTHKTNIKNSDYMSTKTGLLQSVSVPKLSTLSTKRTAHNYTKGGVDDLYLRSNLSHININKSSENLNSSKISKLIPPSLAALNSNMSSSNINNSEKSASSEVKLKLKNAILQRLDRDKIAKSNSNINEAKLGKASINVTRSQNYLFEHQNHFKQSFHSMLQNSNLNNINENNVYSQQYLHYIDGTKELQCQIPYQDIALFKAPTNHNLTKQIEILNQLEENNLRRTTSEPNLKVKSALKDRLLEKRNLLNPFFNKRTHRNHSDQSPPLAKQATQTSNKNIHSNTNSISSNNLSKPKATLSSVEFYQNKSYQNDQILAALAQSATPAVGQSTPELMSLHNQKQQLAVSALLSLSQNSQNELNEDQQTTNIFNTLRHLHRQHYQQNNANMNEHYQLIESLAATSALNQKHPANRYCFNQQELGSSLSYPVLPSQLMLNMTNIQKQQDHSLRQTKENSLERLKFGHAVHVEEENEMLLENELKIAAKLNDTQAKLLAGEKGSQSPPGEECEIEEMARKDYNMWNSRPLLTSASSINIGNHNQDLNKPHLLNYSHFYQQKFKESSHINLIQQQKKQQEMEQLTRQKHYQKSQLSFFSDPHLLRSLEAASINSQPNILIKKNYIEKSLRSSIHPELISKSSDIEQNIFKQPENQIIPMDCTVNQSEERIYRYTTGIVYDTAMLKHECTCYNSNNHLETADRIKSIWNRFKSRDLIDECELVTTKLASISDLLLTHNEQYALIFGSDIEMRPKLPKEYLQTYMMNICLASCRGFALTYDQDNSWNEEHTPLACRVAIGSTYEMARLITGGKLKNGFSLVRPPGSHAEFNKPLGFCYFNTVAIVAKMLRKNLLLDRILIVDWDVHHGNGTQQMTYNDPNILYVSLHRHDNGNFFPGTGSVDECGAEAGLGKNVNIAFNGKLNPPMSDAEYLAAFRCVVMPIAKAFKPQIVLVSCGFDGTENHAKELGGYKVSPMCFGYMTKKLMSLADGKVVLVLEGGYDKKSLCDCSEICLNALINKQIPTFPEQTLDQMPNNTAIEDLEHVIEIQKTYWPDLKENKKYIRMSQNQFISIRTD